MSPPNDNAIDPPSILEHGLNRHFPALLEFESTRELHASELWREIRVEAERVLNAVVAESSHRQPGGEAVLERMAIYPAKHFITNRPTIERATKAIRDELATRLGQIEYSEEGQSQADTQDFIRSIPGLTREFLMDIGLVRTDLALRLANQQGMDSDLCDDMTGTNEPVAN